MKLLFISLGCDKNLVDTEKMLGLLGHEGYSFVDDENVADIIVVNTCCFIGDAKEESINTLIEMGTLKESAKLKLLIAAQDGIVTDTEFSAAVRVHFRLPEGKVSSFDAALTELSAGSMAAEELGEEFLPGLRE